MAHQSRTASKVFSGTAVLAACLACTIASAQATGEDEARRSDAAKTTAPASFTNYIVGPQDVLTITSYDQADLSGKFIVDADGTFSFPLIGRFKAGGSTLRDVEQGLKTRLRNEGFFNNPQVSVAVEQYRSQKVIIVGEVRTPGAYSLSGGMSLVELLARAGSTLPTASGDAVIVHAAAGTPIDPNELPAALDEHSPNTVRVNLRDLEHGLPSQNAMLRDGDTIFVPRAASVYVFGQVKNPGAYALQERDTTVLQALSLAGGLTDHGADGRIQIIRIVNGERRELKAKFSDLVRPGDTVMVPERFF